MIRVYINNKTSPVFLNEENTYKEAIVWLEENGYKRGIDWVLYPSEVLTTETNINYVVDDKTNHVTYLFKLPYLDIVDPEVAAMVKLKFG